MKNKIGKVVEAAVQSRQTQPTSMKGTFNIRIIALKLILTYGLTEVVGLIQIPGHYSEGVTEVLAFTYTCMRSLRGLSLFFIYIGRRSVILFYWNHLKELCTNNKTSPASLRQ